MTRFRVVLVALYAAGVALLTWQLPHRFECAYSLPAGTPAYLFGFSPDGGLIATASDDPINASEHRRITVSVWDVSGQSVRVAERPFGRLAYLGWNWPDDPGRRWLFWQCHTADDPEAKLAQLYPGVTVDPERLDPTETPPRFRVSADGRYYLLRVPPKRFEVTERVGGRVLWTTPTVETTPVFGPGPDELTVLEPAREDGRFPVARYELPSGRETFRTAVELPAKARPRLTSDGRRILTGDFNEGQRRFLNALMDVDTGRRLILVKYRSRNPVSESVIARWVDPPGRLVTVEHGSPGGQSLESRAYFWPATGGNPFEVAPAAHNFDFAPIAAAHPDGSAVALYCNGWLAPGWNLPPWARAAYAWVTGTGGPASGTLMLCDGETGKTRAVLPLANAQNNRVTGEGLAAFAPDGQRLAVADATGVHIWNWPPGRPWFLILTWAAAPPAALAMAAAVVRRLRRGRR